jgi:hypothetical protein
MNNKISKYKGKRLIFLFDTNIYRNIARMAKEGQIIGNRFIIDEITRRESKNGSKSILSLTASQELLIHLSGDANVGDYEECYNALRFQFFHTQILQTPQRIPLMDSLLTFFFYNSDTRDKRMAISEYIFEIIAKIFLQNIELSHLRNDILAIKNDFLCDKKVVHSLFKLLLSQLENIDGGTYKRGNPKLNDFIKKEEYVDYIRNFLIARTKYQCNSETNDINENKIQEFNKYFHVAFLQFKYLFELLRDNPSVLESLENSENNIWNAVMDFHLVFEWCFVKYFNREKKVEVVLVTQDRKRNFASLHDHTDVWNIWEYFEFFEFGIDKTNPLKPIIVFGDSTKVRAIAE